MNVRVNLNITNINFTEEIFSQIVSKCYIFCINFYI